MRELAGCPLNYKEEIGDGYWYIDRKSDWNQTLILDLKRLSVVNLVFAWIKKIDIEVLSRKHKTP